MSRRLRIEYRDAERIKEQVCRRYRLVMDELHRSRRGVSNEPRNVAIYLLKSLRGSNLEEIGRGNSM
jgi:chromosomal replication initiation ATPase DnaA